MREFKPCAGGCGRYVLTFTGFEMLNYCKDCREKGTTGGTIKEIERENKVKVDK